MTPKATVNKSRNCIAKGWYLSFLPTVNVGWAGRDEFYVRVRNGKFTLGTLWIISVPYFDEPVSLISAICVETSFDRYLLWHLQRIWMLKTLPSIHKTRVLQGSCSKYSMSHSWNTGVFLTLQWTGQISTCSLTIFINPSFRETYWVSFAFSDRHSNL